MSAAAVQAAAVAALRADAVIAAAVSGVFDGPPPRAAFPYLTVDGQAVDWSVKGTRGREVRLGVTVWDEAGGAARIQALTARVEATVEALPKALDGWRVASVSFVRGRIVRDGGGPWAGLVEYRVRVLAG